MIDVTRKRVLSVACPTCGVTAGECCLLNCGLLRVDPRVDRRLSAAEAVETKRSHRVKVLRTEHAR